MIQFDAKCEIYSLGILLLEVLEGQVQGADDVDLRLIEHVQDKDMIMADAMAGDWASECVQQLDKLVRGCLKQYPKRSRSRSRSCYFYFNNHKAAA